MSEQQGARFDFATPKQIWNSAIDECAKHFPHTDLQNRLVCDCGIAVGSVGKWYQHLMALKDTVPTSTPTEIHKPGQIPVNSPVCSKCGKMFLECQCGAAAGDEKGGAH